MIMDLKLKPRSPSLEGFRAIFRIPSLGLAEVAWRWSFAVAVATFLIFGVLQFLDTLPVTSGEIALLRTRQPALVARAMSHIFHGSGPRVIAAAIVIGFCVGVAWMFVASLGRAAGIRAILDYFRLGWNSSQTTGWRLSSMIGLNFFRVAATLAALIGCLGALLLASSPSSATSSSPGIAALVFFATVALVIFVWSVLNWFLSLASIFAAGEGRDTFGALASSVDLFRRRSGPVLAVSTWFGLAHAGAFFLFSVLAMIPIAFTKVLPARAVLLGVLVVVLLYFAVADFLRVGRLAGYIYISYGPELAPSIPTPQLPGSPLPPAPSARVDQDELILSDLSANPI
jgi:hypothetical protein